MHTVTIIQARTGSSRLPRKILYPVMNRPLLLHLVDRVRRAELAGTVVVATTTLSEDIEILDLCRNSGIPVFAGHPTDLLDRHYQAAKTFDADAVVKIPSDCPLIDPLIIDRVISEYRSGPFDYVSNLHPPSWPDGNDVEIMSVRALEIAWRQAGRSLEREHTTPYLWENPSLFRIGNVIWETGMNYSMTHRWTLDYEEDLVFVRTVYEKLMSRYPFFGLSDILTLIEREPDIGDINSCFAGVNWYRHHLHELQTIHADQTRQIPTS